jgi:predicted esterase
VGNAQGSQPPKKVSTSTGIFDVASPDEIHKFSAGEVRELVRMENRRYQGSSTVPHPVLVYCFEERTFRYTGGKYKNTPIKYRLHTPQTIRSDQKYPLVVHLHGSGESGSNNTSSLVHLHTILPLMIGPEQKDFFLLVTQCPKETPYWYFQSTKDGTLDVLMAAIEHVIAKNPIDETQITITGVSSGGWGVWQALLEYPDFFAGAVPTACGAPQYQRLAALKQTPIWSFINKGDIDPKSILSAMSVINSAGGSMALTECNVRAHNAWRPAMADYNALEWMLAQKKGSSSPPPGANRQIPFLLAFVLFVLPLSIIVFLGGKTIYNRVFSEY